LRRSAKAIAKFGFWMSWMPNAHCLRPRPVPRRWPPTASVAEMERLIGEPLQLLQFSGAPITGDQDARDTDDQIVITAVICIMAGATLMWSAPHEWGCDQCARDAQPRRACRRERT
jgi:hypothetical protein